MRIVRGRAIHHMSRDDVLAAAAERSGVTLDIGAGDGAWAARYALQHPGRLVIAIDAVAENLREWSARAARKPDRGGIPNALYVVAAVEAPPHELLAIADELFITLPWGSLMRGLILGEPAILRAIAGLAADGAPLRIVLNTRIFDDPVPLDVRDLPEATPDHARDLLAPLYAAAGVTLTAARWMHADEVAALGTTWAKRLSHRAPPRSLLIEARVGPPGPIATPPPS